MDELWEGMASVWTLSWLGLGCFVGTGGVCVDVIMVCALWEGIYITEALSCGGCAEFAA